MKEKSSCHTDTLRLKHERKKKILTFVLNNFKKRKRGINPKPTLDACTRDYNEAA